mmetsp:Transcript_129701/g.276731  ORF Transcript_129701/g.276731 Transcript_129701/m.276731 type:complete len:353 (+) Transcript_129701:771-1829(+)
MPHSTSCWDNAENFSRVSLLRMDFTFRATSASSHPPLLVRCCAAQELSETCNFFGAGCADRSAPRRLLTAPSSLPPRRTGALVRSSPWGPIAAAARPPRGASLVGDFEEPPASSTANARNAPPMASVASSAWSSSPGDVRPRQSRSWCTPKTVGAASSPAASGTEICCSDTAGASANSSSSSTLSSSSPSSASGSLLTEVSSASGSCTETGVSGAASSGAAFSDAVDSSVTWSNASPVHSSAASWSSSLQTGVGAVAPQEGSSASLAVVSTTAANPLSPADNGSAAGSCVAVRGATTGLARPFFAFETGASSVSEVSVYSSKLMKVTFPSVEVSSYWGHSPPASAYWSALNM